VHAPNVCRYMKQIYGDEFMVRDRMAQCVSGWEASADSVHRGMSVEYMPAPSQVRPVRLADNILPHACRCPAPVPMPF
jgi:hypothetical protein